MIDVSYMFEFNYLTHFLPNALDDVVSKEEEWMMLTQSLNFFGSFGIFTHFHTWEATQHIR